MTLTTKDREDIQADLADERQKLEHKLNSVAVPGCEEMRQGWIELKRLYIERLERMLEDG